MAAQLPVDVHTRPNDQYGQLLAMPEDMVLADVQGIALQPPRRVRTCASAMERGMAELATGQISEAASRQVRLARVCSMSSVVIACWIKLVDRTVLEYLSLVLSFLHCLGRSDGAARSSEHRIGKLRQGMRPRYCVACRQRGSARSRSGAR